MNTHKPAGLDIARRLKRLLKRHHEDLHKSRARIDAIFVTTDGEDGAPVKEKGILCIASPVIVPARYRGGMKADAVVLIDKDGFDELTDKQQDAWLDHALQHLQPSMQEDVIATDGNDRPKLKLRAHDVTMGFFSDIAKRWGENSPEVIACRGLVDHSREVFLPGFDVLAKPLPGKRAKKAKPLALTEGQKGNVIDLSETKTAERMAAK